MRSNLGERHVHDAAGPVSDPWLGTHSTSFSPHQAKPPRRGWRSGCFSRPSGVGGAANGAVTPSNFGRIFERHDLEYVAAQAPARIQELFLEERQKVVLSWVGQIRKQILSLKQFHLRFGALLCRSQSEYGIAISLGVFSAARHLPQQCGSPSAGEVLMPRPTWSGRAAATAARVCDLSARSLDFLKTSRLNRSAGIRFEILRCYKRWKRI